MNDLNTAIANLNAVLDGSKKVHVDAKISNEDLLKLTAAIFMAYFLATLLANAITK